MEKVYVIYCHTNISTNQKYIGQTKNKNPEYRWNNGRGYKRNEQFYTDIQKYGWQDGFQHEIIKTHLTAQEANYWEDYYINYYDTLNPEKGYNLKKVGTGVPSNESLQHMSTGQIKRYQNVQERQKTSKAVKQFYIDNPEQSLERKKDLDKWRDNNPDWKDKLKEKTSIKVICLETKEIYDSISEASRITGINRKGINRCILEQQRVAGGYHWAVADNNTSIEEINIKFENNKTNTKKVQCIETGEIFSSIANATRKYGGDIKACVKGRQKTAGGFHWRYFEE